MTPAAFIEKWSRSELRERQGSQEHFIDLCRLLGEPTPAEEDATGQSYCFERGATKVGGGDGWADVWRRGKFGWEYKGKHKDLNAALRQLQIYAPDLENPPYLVVSDMERIVVHTNWTNTVRRTIPFGFDDLREPAKLEQLRQVFRGSDALKPGLSPQELTAKVATRFGDLGKRLQERGHDPRAVAHFLNRLMFCMFAEDSELLPRGLFTRTVKAVQNRPKHAPAQLGDLFAKMASGGFFGADVIAWFNGGLFDDAEALPLEREDLKLIADTAAEHDWSNIDPAVFGTMFEEALKTTGRRAALGAHYTDRDKIMKIVDPVIIRPLTAEWEDARRAMSDALDEVASADAERKAVYEGAADLLKQGAAAYKSGEAARRKTLAAIDKRAAEARGRAKEIRDGYLDRLAAFRVLDPACGSGNFLYVALHALRDLELRALLDADRLGIPQERPRVGLDAVRGIEIEAYAAELARVTLWIGNLQWERRNGYTAYAEPILSSLDSIENRDALLNHDGTEAAWPEADVIVGNPPFLGGKRLRDGLGDDTVERLFAAYRGRVPAEADLVCYWVEKAWRAVSSSIGHASPGVMLRSGEAASRSTRDDGASFDTPALAPPDRRAPQDDEGDGAGGRVLRVGLVTTNSIRGGVNRRVLEPIANAHALRDVWPDEPWVLEGAAVRVSMVGFGWSFVKRRLNGDEVEQINADLTAGSLDLTQAIALSANDHIAFIGDQKGGPFDVPGEQARLWLSAPLNPNGRPNSDVLRPWRNGRELTKRSKDIWIIYFDEVAKTENFASLYQAPFEWIRQKSSAITRSQRELHTAKRWWLHQRSRPALRAALQPFRRYIANPRNATYKLFVWLPTIVVPDSQLVVFARDDETAFGVLHSRTHELWALRLGTWLGVGNDPRNTVTTTFDTFPFPEGLTPNIPAADYADDPRAVAIAEAAAELNRLRETWLNPPDLVRIAPEVVAGYPDRILPVDEAAAAILKRRTLTNLYNERPTWLDNAHRRLDAAVAAAYGWPSDLSDDAILERLFALNQERAAAGR